MLSKKELMQKMDTVLSQEQKKIVNDNIEENNLYTVHFTSDSHKFAECVILKNHHSEIFGLGESFTHEKGVKIINGNLEFGQDNQYNYKDSSIELGRFEKRYTNFNIKKTYVTMIESHNYSSFAYDTHDYISYRVCVYIPDNKIVEGD